MEQEPVGGRPHYGYDTAFPTRTASGTMPAKRTYYTSGEQASQAPAPVTVVPVSQRAPVSKRPRGRWVIGLLLLTLVSLAAWSLWNAFFRYQAFGVVTGRVVSISPGVEGMIQLLHVTEGDRVENGQVLITIDNVELRQQHARLTDEMKVAQAELLTDKANLRWRSASQADEYQEAVTEYYRVWAQLVVEKSRLEEAEVNLARATDAYAKQAVNQRELELLRIARDGRRANVEKLEQAVAEAKRRIELSADLVKEDQDALAARLARIESISGEMARVREQIDLCQVKATAAGVVVQQVRKAGERVNVTDPVVTVLEDRSVEVALYVEQRHSGQFKVGDEVGLIVEPRQQRLGARVLRIGRSLVPAPPGISRQYRADEQLLPVFLAPTGDAAATLRLNEVVRLPRSVNVEEFWRGGGGNAKP